MSARTQQEAIEEMLVLDGYSLEELQDAFDEVCNDNDWKGPIDAQVIDKTDEELERIKFAVQFFTATKCQIVDMTGVEEACDNITRVTKVMAAGYRNGSAGP
jgi:hypothetical protein